MSNNATSSPFQLRDAHYAALHRDVLVHDLLDQALSLLGLPSQGLKKLAHERVSPESGKCVLRAVAALARDSAEFEKFESLLANLAIQRRDWPLMRELGVRGVSHEEHSLQQFPDGSAVNRFTGPGYYDRAAWTFSDGRGIPRLVGEGYIEQVARHLADSLLAIAAVRLGDMGVDS